MAHSECILMTIQLLCYFVRKVSVYCVDTYNVALAMRDR